MIVMFACTLIAGIAYKVGFVSAIADMTGLQ